MTVQFYEGIGRRKTCTARVRILKGSGNFTVNNKAINEYFTRLGDIDMIMSPLKVAGENHANLDISVIARGGGVSGQTAAVQLGVARALLEMNSDYRSVLRNAGFLTRDARIKERKKPGLKRARKAPTYTKR